jgi:hypothetical protein
MTSVLSRENNFPSYINRPYGVLYRAGMQITGLHPALNYAIQSLGELCFKLNKSNAAQFF